MAAVRRTRAGGDLKPPALPGHQVLLQTHGGPQPVVAQTRQNLLRRGEQIRPQPVASQGQFDRRGRGGVALRLALQRFEILRPQAQPRASQWRTWRSSGKGSTGLSRPGVQVGSHRRQFHLFVPFALDQRLEVLGSRQLLGDLYGMQHQRGLVAQALESVERLLLLTGDHCSALQIDHPQVLVAAAQGSSGLALGVAGGPSAGEHLAAQILTPVPCQGGDDQDGEWAVAWSSLRPRHTA